jgi:hypothetical protein
MDFRNSLVPSMARLPIATVSRVESGYQRLGLVKVYKRPDPN